MYGRYGADYGAFSFRTAGKARQLWQQQPSFLRNMGGLGAASASDRERAGVYCFEVELLCAAKRGVVRRGGEIAADDEGVAEVDGSSEHISSASVSSSPEMSTD